MSPPASPSTRRARDVGLDVRSPRSPCDDPPCPFHGRLSVRGQVLEGTVVSTSMQRTAVVERTLLHYLSKYERFTKRRRRYLAHLPPCLGAAVGHKVRIAESRPLSKAVSFCVVEDLGEAARREPGEEAVPPSEGRSATEAAE